MYKFRSVVAALLLASMAAWAGPFEDAFDAYRKRDYALALRLWQSLAEAGNAGAQSNVGHMHINGYGVPKDGQQALIWFRKAADQGNAIAQYNIGLMYDSGEGVPKDDQQALLWYRKAADHGHTAAQFNLGVMYATGQGVPKDDQQAYFWWLLASEGGGDASVNSRDLVEARLTPQQRAAARADARNWKPRKP